MSSKSPMPILKEIVVAAWENKSGDVCGLGCATPFNEQDPNLMLTVMLNEEREQVFARLALSVMVKGGGNRKLRGFDFIIPLHSLGSAVKPALDFSTIDISEVQDDSIRAAISDAHLLKSGSLIRAEFNLCERGSVVTPWKEEPRFTTCSDTSLDLLSGLFSLREAQDFVLYMRRSDYAVAGLRRVQAALQNVHLGPWAPEATGVYDGRTVMTVTRDRIESGRKHRNRKKKPACDAPPPFDKQDDAHASLPPSKKQDATVEPPDLHESCADIPPPYDHSAVLVPRSPSADFTRRQSTPTDSILAEESSFSDVVTDAYKTALATIEDTGPLPFVTGKRKRTDEDREILRRALSQRLKQWLILAFKENDRVYQHTILTPFFDETIPNCVDECDAAKFDVGIAYATAVLACDPQGSCDLYWAYESEFFGIVNDVKELVLWAMRRNPGAELRLWRKFMELGAVVPEVLRSGERDAYDDVKADITASLIVATSVRRNDT